MNDYSNENGHSNTGLTVATFALIIAIIALVLGWAAYNRTGQDLEDNVRNTTNSAAESAGENAQQGVDSFENSIDTGPDGVDDGAQ